ncbi:GIY-YIG nuclease family protein [Paenibacillus sp. FSL L8-0470]|uniref:GIY-YIG nuclease family protein n=1 Tax=Paenibacillus sp. FSL L8-0470 TaxID=2954688 RepID=UPI0030FBC05C
MQIEKEINKRIITIYVLELEGGNYYVGQTTNLKRRLEEHLEGRRASHWTKLHKIVKLIESTDLRSVNSKNALVEENEVALKYMSIYGWKKVRGGCYNLIDEGVTYKTLLKRKKKDRINFDL